MTQVTRRDFLAHTTRTAALATGAGLFSVNAQGANEKVVVGLMGVRERGSQLAGFYGQHPKVSIKYLADPDTNLFEKRVADVRGITGQAPACVQDFRRVLDDPEVDAVVVATPDHWHALGAVLACQAGKHVYVEKPLCHNLWEGRQVIAAAEKYGRVVQVGTQNRSMPCVRKALEYARSSDFGEMHLIRIVNDKARPPLTAARDMDVPEGVDYDMWLGPAKQRAFNTHHFHYNWHWFWEYSGGDIMNDGVHQLDIVRMFLQQDFPSAVYSTGGSFYFHDVQETPDTQAVNYDFGGCLVVYEQALWTRYMKKDPHESPRLKDKTPWSFNGTRIEVYGSKQQLMLARHGGGWEAFDSSGASVHREPSERNDPIHIDNFIQAIRGEGTVNAPPSEGHRSTALCHMANISYLLKRRLNVDTKTGAFLDDPEANAHFLAKRAYRDPWRMPEEV